MSARKTTVELIFLCILGLAVYFPVLNAPYLYDDHRVIAMSQTVLSDTANATEDQRTVHQPTTSLWKQPRPLRQLSHAVDQTLFGNSPSAAHIVNVLLHALVAFVGCLLLRQTGMPRKLAFLASLIFLLLPACVESVAIVSHRKEMLAALFLFLGLRLALQGGWSAWIRAGLCFAIATAGKETALIFPLLFLVLSLAVRQRQPQQPRPFLSTRTLRAAALLLAFALVLGLVNWLQISASVDAFGTDKLALGLDRLGHLSPNATWGTACRMSIWAFSRYLLMMVSPYGHTLNPAIPLNDEVLSTAFILSLLASVGFGIAVIATFRRRHTFCAPLLWIAASLSIVLFPPLLRSGATAVYADRYAYLAAFGTAWLIASAMGLLTRIKQRPRIALWLAMSLLIVYGIGTHLNARNFQSETTLWTHVLKLNPAHYHAEYNLARDAWKQKNDRNRALTHFRRMSEIEPGFAFGHCAFSEFLAESGSFRDAIQILDGCLASCPESPHVYAQRGMYRLKEGHVNEAAADFAQAIRLGGDDPILFHNYGMAQEMRAQWKEAAALYARAARHPAFRNDANRVKLLTQDPPATTQNHNVRQTLIVDATVSPRTNASRSPTAAALADILNQRFVQRGTKGHIFQPADVSNERRNGLAAAISQKLKNPAQFANCLLLIDSRNTVQDNQSDALLREISRCIMSCRINRTRPLLVWLNPSPTSEDPSAAAPKQENLALAKRLHTFCSESNVILIGLKARQNLSDRDRNERTEGTPSSQTLAELENISDQILDLFTAEDAAMLFRKP